MNFPEPGQTFPGKNDVYIFIMYQNYFESHVCCESHGMFWTLLFVDIDDHIWKVNKLFFFILNQFFFQFHIRRQGILKKYVNNRKKIKFGCLMTKFCEFLTVRFEFAYKYSCNNPSLFI